MPSIHEPSANRWHPHINVRPLFPLHARMSSYAPPGPPHSRTWVWGYFRDHPKLSLKSPEAFSGTGSTRDKPKVFCKKCLGHRINQQRLEDEKQVENGTCQEVRTDEMIELDCMLFQLHSVIYHI
jgi:hypothetical protein